MSAKQGSAMVLRTAQALSLSIASALVLFSGVVYLDWSRDKAMLRQQALEVTRGARDTSDAIIRLNQWVYGHGGFAKNEDYYVFPWLGPTPVQILHSGGDCGDKSRLLSAMLHQIGIPSGLVMVYSCPVCRPIHTVVEADYGKGRMVVDPVWNIDYPASGDRYYGLRDLAGTSLGREHLRQLKAQSSPSAKISAMPPEEATFDYARGVNWNRNALLRLAAGIMKHFGIEPAFLQRPRILEDPQLASCATLLFLACGLFVIGLRLRAARSSRHAAPRDQSYRPVPSWH